MGAKIRIDDRKLEPSLCREWRTCVPRRGIRAARITNWGLTLGSLTARSIRKRRLKGKLKTGAEKPAGAPQSSHQKIDGAQAAQIQFICACSSNGSIHACFSRQNILWKL